MPATMPAIHAYRQLLRTVRHTFKGDFAAIRLAHGEIRDRFNENKNLTSKSEVNKRLADAHEAREFIAENIVQAEKSSCGTLAVSPDNARRLNDMAPEDIKGDKNR